MMATLLSGCSRRVGLAAGHHCRACQWARSFRVSASEVSPVSTSPALLIADQYRHRH
jgi:hypothetical protein